MVALSIAVAKGRAAIKRAKAWNSEQVILLGEKWEKTGEKKMGKNWEKPPPSRQVRAVFAVEGGTVWCVPVLGWRWGTHSSYGNGGVRGWGFICRAFGSKIFCCCWALPVQLLAPSHGAGAALAQGPRGALELTQLCLSARDIQHF